MLRSRTRVEMPRRWRTFLKMHTWYQVACGSLSWGLHTYSVLHTGIVFYGVPPLCMTTINSNGASSGDAIDSACADVFEIDVSQICRIIVAKEQVFAPHYTGYRCCVRKSCTPLGMRIIYMVYIYAMHPYPSLCYHISYIHPDALPHRP